MTEVNDNREMVTERIERLSGENAKGQRDNEDIKARIAMLEAERIAKATQEIQAVLDKYGVMLQAVAVIPASKINIVPMSNG